MSRAFVRDLDEAPETLPERPVSRHPNLVTAAGLAKIEAQLRALELARRAAADDADALGRIERDTRYWRQRRATARVIEPPEAPSVVRFGVTVRLRLEDGSERCLQIVGEDEADPAAGLVSWTSPVATSLIGRLAGDSIELFGQRAQIEELLAAEGTGEQSALIGTHSAGSPVTASTVAASTVAASHLAANHPPASALDPDNGVAR